MGHADLRHPLTPGPELDEQLGRQERRIGRQVQAVEDLAPEDLHRTVDVADAKAEEDRDDGVVGLGDEDPMRRIAPLDAVADDRVERPGRRPRADRAGGELLEIELEVAVAEADELPVRVREPGTQGAAVAAIRLVVDPHARVGRRQRIGKLRSAVGRAVVDDQDLDRAVHQRTDVVSARRTVSSTFSSSLKAGKKNVRRGRTAATSVMQEGPRERRPGHRTAAAERVRDGTRPSGRGPDVYSRHLGPSAWRPPSEAPHLMTHDPVGRRGAGTIDRLRRLDAGTILAAILVAGLLLRIFIAAVYLPMSGLANDIGSFSAWGQRMASLGPGGFYEEGYFADYPPGYLYVLWFLGTVGQALTPLVGQNATGGLVKIPGILADIGVAWLLFLLARRWGGQLIDRTRFRVSAETLGLAAADDLPVQPWSHLRLGHLGPGRLGRDPDPARNDLCPRPGLDRGRSRRRRPRPAGEVPVRLPRADRGDPVGLKRHLSGRSADPEHGGRRDLLRVLTSAAAGVVTLILLLLPFGMSIFVPDPAAHPLRLPGRRPGTSLIGKFCEASQTYQGLSISAFNIWRNPLTGLGDTFFRGDDTSSGWSLGGMALTWQQVGTLLFAAVASSPYAGRAPRRPAGRSARRAAHRDRLLRAADARPRALSVPGDRPGDAARLRRTDAGRGSPAPSRPSCS